MNSLLNPSGLGDLSFGSCLTTSSISMIVKGCSKDSSPSCTWIREGRSKSIPLYSVCPILCLKECHINCSLSAWEVIISLFSVLRLAMIFLLCLMFAFAWKNLVPASLKVAHLIAPICFQYILCCSSRDKSFSLRMDLKFHSFKLSLYIPPLIQATAGLERCLQCKSSG